MVTVLLGVALFVVAPCAIGWRFVLLVERMGRGSDDLSGCACEDCDERLELSDTQVEFQFRQIVADYDKEEAS